MYSPLTATETEIIGQWSYIDGAIHEDVSTKRIHWLLEGYLIYIGVDESGWQKRYVNPADGQCWELSFSQSQRHGGGPPTITRIDEGVAQQ